MLRYESPWCTWRKAFSWCTYSAVLFVKKHLVTQGATARARELCRLIVRAFSREEVYLRLLLCSPSFEGLWQSAPRTGCCGSDITWILTDNANSRQLLSLSQVNLCKQRQSRNHSEYLKVLPFCYHRNSMCRYLEWLSCSIAPILLHHHTSGAWSVSLWEHFHQLLLGRQGMKRDLRITNSPTKHQCAPSTEKTSRTWVRTATWSGDIFLLLPLILSHSFLHSYLTSFSFSLAYTR